MIQVIVIPSPFFKKNLSPKRDKLIVIEFLTLLLLIIYTNKAIWHLIDPLITMIMNEKLQEQASRLPQYEVEKIIDERKDGNRALFLVKWVGYPHQENTWQPRSHLKNAPQKIRQWQRYKKQRLQKTNSSKSSQLLKFQPTSIRGLPIKTTLIDKESTRLTNLRQSKRNKERGEALIKTHINSLVLIDNSTESINQQKILALNSREESNMKKQNQKLKSNKNSSNKSQPARLTRRIFLNNLIEYNHTQLPLNGQQNTPLTTKKKGQDLSSSQKQRTEDQCQHYQHLNEANLIGQDNICKKEIIAGQQNIAFAKQSQRDQEPISKKDDSELKMTLQPKMQEEKCVQNQEIDSQRFIVQYREDQLQSVSPIPHIRQIKVDPSLNLNPFEVESHQQFAFHQQPDFFSFAAITMMYKDQSRIKVYCEVQTLSGQIVENIPYEKLERERPDLVCTFFCNKFPCK